MIAEYPTEEAALVTQRCFCLRLYDRGGCVAGLEVRANCEIHGWCEEHEDCRESHALANACWWSQL